MSLRDAIAALPDDALVPVGWVRDQLEHAPASAPAAATVDVDLTVAQVAARFDRGASTIRTWCENGQLPGAYRLHGREWRIPASAVRSLQRAASEGKPATKAAELPKAEIGAWRDHLPSHQ